MIDLEGFAEESRVWIYQSNRPFDEDTASEVRKALNQFAQNWVAHNQALKAKAELIRNQFIILAVDETQAGASGCSIDASVHFLKTLQANLGVDLFDRMLFTYLENDQVQTVDRTTFADLYANGVLTDETLVVDTLVNKKEGLKKMIKPLGESWHARMV